jgi:hypothetical protein
LGIIKTNGAHGDGFKATAIVAGLFFETSGSNTRSSSTFRFTGRLCWVAAHQIGAFCLYRHEDSAWK